MVNQRNLTVIITNAFIKLISKCTETSLVAFYFFENYATPLFHKQDRDKRSHTDFIRTGLKLFFSFGLEELAVCSYISF